MQVKVLLKIEIYGFQKRKYTYENFKEFTPNINHISHFPKLRHPRRISDILKKKLSAKLP
jgi:hypothetical protein